MRRTELHIAMDSRQWIAALLAVLVVSFVRDVVHCTAFDDWDIRQQPEEAGTLILTDTKDSTDPPVYSQNHTNTPPTNAINDVTHNTNPNPTSNPKL